MLCRKSNLVKQLSQFKYLKLNLNNFSKTFQHVSKYIYRNNSSLSNFSYLHETGIRPLTSATIGNFVDNGAEKYADREAIVDWINKIRWTFPQMKQEVDKLATGFLKLGLNRNDRIGIWAPNRYEWMITQFAAAKAGLILVTLNPGYQIPELEYCIKKVGLRAIVTQEKIKTQEYYKIMASIIPEITQTQSGMKIKSQKHPYFDTLVVMTDNDLPGAFKIKDVWTAGGTEEINRLEKLQTQISFEDIACIKFTSGTTGRPKGVTLSHHNIVNGAYSTVATKFDAEIQRHRVCATVPFFHVFGCITTIINNLINGATTVIPFPVFHPPTILQCIEKEKCTAVLGTPTMYIDMLNALETQPTEMSSMKLGIVSGAPISSDLMRKVIEKFKCHAICSGYGATELAGGAFDCYPDDPIEVKANTAGSIHYYTEAKIVDPEGNVVPLGITGEIWIRGYKVMKGYWDEDEQTREVITKDGWYKTGDVGLFNKDKTLTVLERISDIIIRGGENLYPKEIEDCLMTHPNIIEAQVIGVPDERLGEVVCAWVRLRPNQQMNESEVKEFCKANMTRAKVPFYVQFTDNFPRTLSGKVQKFALREKMNSILKKR